MFGLAKTFEPLDAIDAAAAEASRLGVPLPAADLRPLAAEAAARDARVRQQRVAAGKARAQREAERNGPWRMLALGHARKLRAAKPEITRVEVARKIKEAFGPRLPTVSAIIDRLKVWENAGRLAMRIYRNHRGDASARAPTEERLP